MEQTDGTTTLAPSTAEADGEGEGLESYSRLTPNAATAAARLRAS